MLYKVTYDLVATPASTASEPVRSFSDAGMKLVYLIFCDDMVLNDKKKLTLQYYVYGPWSINQGQAWVLTSLVFL